MEPCNTWQVKYSLNGAGRGSSTGKVGTDGRDTVGGEGRTGEGFRMS